MFKQSKRRIEAYWTHKQDRVFFWNEMPYQDWVRSLRNTEHPGEAFVAYLMSVVATVRGTIDRQNPLARTENWHVETDDGSDGLGELWSVRFIGLNTLTEHCYNQSVRDVQPYFDMLLFWSGVRIRGEKTNKARAPMRDVAWSYIKAIQTASIAINTEFEKNIKNLALLVESAGSMA